MKCSQCATENADGTNFCATCGSVLSPQLIPLVRAQVEEYIRQNFKDQKIVDIETTEAIAGRFEKWGKWFLVPATILITLLGLLLALIGIRDISDVDKAAQKAIASTAEATKSAKGASTKAEEAQQLSMDATKAIHDATEQMKTELAKAQQLSATVSGVESRTSNQIAAANKRVDDKMGELDKKVTEANKAIAAQQSKLLSTNELLTAMFSSGQVETFQTNQGNNARFVILPTTITLPPGMPMPQGLVKAVVFMLLPKAAILQTVQLNSHVYVQPKASYFLRGNLLTFVWGDSLGILTQWPLEVSYVPDPTYKGTLYKTLSIKDGHVFADDTQLQ